VRRSYLHVKDDLAIAANFRAEGSGCAVLVRTLRLVSGGMLVNGLSCWSQGGAEDCFGVRRSVLRAEK
jgi:hypothetical protein